nr:uncharacterized protein LOC124805790 [Hydra vulgaris]
MLCELFHNKLKTVYMERRPNKRLDDLINLLLTIEENSYWHYKRDTIYLGTLSLPKKYKKRHEKGMLILINRRTQSSLDQKITDACKDESINFKKKFINGEIGFRIFTNKEFHANEILLEYIFMEIIPRKEAILRHKKYENEKKGCFIYDIDFKGENISIVDEEISLLERVKADIDFMIHAIKSSSPLLKSVTKNLSPSNSLEVDTNSEKSEICTTKSQSLLCTLSPIHDLDVKKSAIYAKKNRSPSHTLSHTHDLDIKKSAIDAKKNRSPSDTLSHTHDLDIKKSAIYATKNRSPSHFLSHTHDLDIKKSAIYATKNRSSLRALSHTHDLDMKKVIYVMIGLL